MSLSQNTNFAEPAPSSPIKAAMASIVEGHETAQDRISLLEDRLDAVLGPKNQGKDGPKAVLGGASEMHSNLSECADQAHGIAARLQGIIDRLTL